MKKKVVITGAAGFVGANLTRRLLKDYQVHAIVRKGGSLWRLEDICKDITIHEGILADKKKLVGLLKKINPYAIYHLAAYGSYPTQQDLDLMIEVNIKGIANIIESLKDLSYHNLLVTGSSSEYGKKVKPMKETFVLEPNNFYAATKASQTHLCQAFAKTYHKPVTLLRLFNVYGFYEEEGRLVRNVIEAVLAGKPILLANGNEARDFIFAEDVADAFIHATKRQFYGEVFNIGTGKQTNIKELAQMVVKLAGKNVPIHLNAYAGRPWDTKYWRADMTKTKTVLGWKPKYSLRDGLKKTIKWYKLPA